MNRTNVTITSILVLTLCWLFCGALTAQSAHTQLKPVPNPTQKLIAYRPQPGQFRWADSSQHSFRSAADACQVWIEVMRYGQLPANNKTSTAISMTGITYSSYSGIPIADCHFRIASAQGQQNSFIRFAAGCGSNAYTPDPKSERCVPVNNAKISVPASQAQSTSSQSSGEFPAQITNAVTSFLQSADPKNQGSPAQDDAIQTAQPARARVINNPDASVSTEELGSFKGNDFVLTAYGCFHSGDVVLCDFDVTKQASAQARAIRLWSTLGLRDENGRIIQRQDAFFVNTDGARSSLATVSTNPVRLIMEFAGVDAQLSAASLVNGKDQIQGVPIDIADPGQPENVIPLRAAPVQSAYHSSPGGQNPAANATSTSTQSSTAAKTKVNPVDAANQAVDKVNQTTDKVKSTKDTLKGISGTLKAILGK